MIGVMQAAEDGHGADRSLASCRRPLGRDGLCRDGGGDGLSDALVGSVVVDVGDVLFEHAAQVACPWHLMLLRQRCAGCEAPLRLAAGQVGCGQCGAVIGAMGTRSLAGDADGRELSALVWRATGCGEGLSLPEGLALATEHPVWQMGTPALLRGLWGLWGGAQAEVARDGGPRLHEREIGAVHEALVARWRGGEVARWRGGEVAGDEVARWRVMRCADPRASVASLQEVL